ncbi:MAG: hypothetical protein IPK82_24320 [Polyangiaceae bacterium]|nr:hypothetical protein [Polyangiaceae bacterium]
MKRAAFIAAMGALVGCSSTLPPPGWQKGGAVLWVPTAAWRVSWLNVDLAQDGSVYMNGTLSFQIDAVGRVIDANGDPVALLQPDGKLIGTMGEDMGSVGPTTAAESGSAYATLAILPSGEVVHFEGGPQTTSRGGWTGCGVYAPSLQACMLVTHLISTRFPPRAPNTGVPPYVNRGLSGPWIGPTTPGLGFGLSPW